MAYFIITTLTRESVFQSTAFPITSTFGVPPASDRIVADFSSPAAHSISTSYPPRARIPST